nr:hypothetical protein [Deltaproteobacteria bacterium]
MKTLALALGLSLAPTLSLAQTPPAPASQRRVAEAPPVVIHVDGVVPRPYYWIQSRSALHYQAPEPRRAFVPTVVRAVRQAPF